MGLCAQGRAQVFESHRVLAASWVTVPTATAPGLQSLSIAFSPPPDPGFCAALVPPAAGPARPSAVPDVGPGSGLCLRRCWLLASPSLRLGCGAPPFRVFRGDMRSPGNQALGLGPPLPVPRASRHPCAFCARPVTAPHVCGQKPVRGERGGDSLGSTARPDTDASSVGRRVRPGRVDWSALSLVPVGQHRPSHRKTGPGQQGHPTRAL